MNISQETKKTILIVDDTETNIDILLELLGNEYDILVALDGKSAFDILEEEVVDLILLDIMMPEINGFEVCSRLKLQSSTRDIPVIFVTAKTDEDSIEKAYDVGGIDYVTKPFKPRELQARIKTQIKLKALVDHLEYISSYDQMTGVFNRRKFFILATEALEAIQINLYAIMIDIDHFKRFNDTYGHAFGDEVIKGVTRAISDTMLEGSIFGRVGGEEFALLTHAISEDIAVENIESMRKAVEALEFTTQDNIIVKCTISLGMAKSDKTLNSLDALLKKADDALYEAKGEGRNRSIFR
jgi:two-component system, glycerol uptake and utilization response regulator